MSLLDSLFGTGAAWIGTSAAAPSNPPAQSLQGLQNYANSQFNQAYGQYNTAIGYRSQMLIGYSGTDGEIYNTSVGHETLAGVQNNVRTGISRNSARRTGPGECAPEGPGGGGAAPGPAGAGGRHDCGLRG